MARSTFVQPRQTIAVSFQMAITVKLTAISCMMRFVCYEQYLLKKKKQQTNKETNYTKLS